MLPQSLLKDAEILDLQGHLRVEAEIGWIGRRWGSHGTGSQQPLRGPQYPAAVEDSQGVSCVLNRCLDFLSLTLR